MSIKIMTRVWESAPFEGYTLMVLLALADSASDEGYCWPKIETLEKKTRCAQRSVYQAIKTLCEKGWLEKLTRDKKTYYRVGVFAPIAENTAPIAEDFAPIAKPPHPLIGRTVIEPSGTKPEGGGKADTTRNREVIQRVFAYFIEKTGRNAKMYTLTESRMKKGLDRLKECKAKVRGDPTKAEELMTIAVDALVSSEFHMGKNDRLKEYNDWTDHLFKSADRLEKWLEQ